MRTWNLAQKLTIAALSLLVVELIGGVVFLHYDLKGLDRELKQTENQLHAVDGTAESIIKEIGRKQNDIDRNISEEKLIDEVIERSKK